LEAQKHDNVLNFIIIITIIIIIIIIHPFVHSFIHSPTNVTWGKQLCNIRVQ
jgi:hypothetical protein